MPQSRPSLSAKKFHTHNNRDTMVNTKSEGLPPPSPNYSSSRSTSQDSGKLKARKKSNSDSPSASASNAHGFHSSVPPPARANPPAGADKDRQMRLRRLELRELWERTNAENVPTPAMITEMKTVFRYLHNTGWKLVPQPVFLQVL